MPVRLGLLLKILCLMMSVSICCASSDEEGKLPDPDVCMDCMYETVKYLTEIQPARNYTNTDSLDKAADYLKKKFIEYGFKPVEQKYQVRGEEYRNIIASFGPDDAPRIIIGAHYDVCGSQPGADDNASAVAGLLETARLLKREKPALKYRVDFAAYTLEEPPFFRTEKMGSHVHAKSLKDDNIDVVGMICLEMIGYYTDAPRSQEFPFPFMKLFYPTTGDFIGVVGRFSDSKLIRQVKNGMKKTDIKVRTLRAPPSVTGVDFSDHQSFWNLGYRAVMVTDTAFYRNPNYHETTDTIDTLDFDAMKEVVKGVYYAIKSIG